MEEESKYFKFGAQVVLPALVSSLALWLAGFGGAQSAQSLLPALFCCYLGGYALLHYAEGMKLPRTYGFYLLFAFLVFSGALVAGGFLQRSPTQFIGSLLLPLAVAFCLPACFEIVKERMKNVQPG